jgi:hypothetical protein
MAQGCLRHTKNSETKTRNFFKPASQRHTKNSVTKARNFFKPASRQHTKNSVTKARNFFAKARAGCCFPGNPQQNSENIKTR